MQRSYIGVAAVGLLAAASGVPAQEPPAVAASAAEAPPELPAPTKPSGVLRWFDPATAPFIPVPEIDIDPQSGVTLGAFATFLSVNDRNEIERITAPDLFHSQYFGWGAGLSLYGFPSQDDQWLVLGNLKERVERAFDARYLAGQTRTTPLSFSLEAIYDRSGTARFFGIGNETPDHAESTYVDDQASLAGYVGYNFTPALQIGYGVRWRTVDVLPGVLSGIPSIETLYPELNGLGSEHVLEHTVTLTRDTRDSVLIPHNGTRYILYGGFSSHELGSSVAYSYLGAEARGYLPVAPDVTLAWHAAARYMPSYSEAPFWALSSLGGDRSVTNAREPLRSEGMDRYVDANLFAAGLEVRTHVAGFDAFGTHVGLEVSPFIDAGKVFANGKPDLLSELHTALGVGMRGIASPYVVGYVDFGYGRGRAAIFSGINYPF